MNLIKELKNANLNGCNIVLRNKQSTPNFFLISKIFKIELNKGLQSLF